MSVDPGSVPESKGLGMGTSHDWAGPRVGPLRSFLPGLLYLGVAGGRASSQGYSQWLWVGPTYWFWERPPWGKQSLGKKTTQGPRRKQL